MHRDGKISTVAGVTRTSIALARQVVRRYAVEAPLKLDVIVDVDRSFAPYRKIEAGGRERTTQRRFIQLTEQHLAATVTLAERALVDFSPASSPMASD